MEAKVWWICACIAFPFTLVVGLWFFSSNSNLKMLQYSIRPNNDWTSKLMHLICSKKHHVSIHSAEINCPYLMVSYDSCVRHRMLSLLHATEICKEKKIMEQIKAKPKLRNSWNVWIIFIPGTKQWIARMRQWDEDIILEVGAATKKILFSYQNENVCAFYCKQINSTCRFAGMNEKWVSDI